MPNGPVEQKFLFERMGLNLFDEEPLEPLTPLEPPSEEQPPAKEKYMFERMGLKLFEPPPEQPKLTPIEQYNKELESKHRVSPSYAQSSGTEGALGNGSFTKDVYASEWQAITQSAKAGDMKNIRLREAIIEDIRRKSQFGEAAQYIGKRMISLIPFVEMDWQKHRLNPLQFAAAADPTSPDDIYSPLIRGVPVPFGQGLRIGIHDIADMATVIGEFGIIGAGTSIPFQLAKTAVKNKKLASGVIRVMAKTPAMKRVINNVAKANVDFQLFNMATVHPEDTKEGATLKDTLQARIKNIPQTALTATLFGSLGSFEKVWQQYGGVFTAGYTSAMTEGLIQGATPGELHAEAMKSGFMLVGAHAANVLGTKGGEYFKKYGKNRGLTDKTLDFIASHIIARRVPDKEVWRSQTKKLTHVQIVKDGINRKKESFLLEDIGNPDNKVWMTKNEFYKHYDKTNHPKEAEKIRTDRLGDVHDRQRKLGMTDKDEYEFKRKIFGQKDPAPEVKEGELPHYVNLKTKTVKQLKKIAELYELEYPENATKQELFDLVDKSIPKSKGEYLSWADASPEQLYKGYEKLDNKVQMERVKDNIKKGLHTEALDADGNKVIIKRTWFNKEPIATVVNLERIIQAYTGEVGAGRFIAESMTRQLNEVVHKNNIQPDNWERIAKAKFGDIDIKDLSAGELEILDIYNKVMEQGAIFGLKEGIFDTIVDNYMTGLYPEMNANTRKKLFGRGPKKTGETMYSKQKVFESPVEAAKAGHKPIYDMRELIGTWFSSIHKAVAEQRLAERLRDLPDVNGDAAVSATRVNPNYIQIDNLPLLSKVVTGSRRKPVWIHPELATPFKILAKPTTTPTGALKIYRNLSNTIKRIIMINPLIHGWNIYSDVMDEYNLRVFKAGRVVLFGEKDWLLLKRAGLVKSKKEFKNLSKEEQTNIMHRLEVEMAHAGIDLATTTSVTSELHGFMGRHFSELVSSEATLKQRFQQLGGRVSGTKGVWGKTKMVGRSMRLGSDTLLWDRWVRNSQVAIYTLLKSRALKSGLTEESAKRVSGHYTKDLLGMLDKEVFGPTSGDVLNYALFARNWTISNMRLVSGALGYRGSNLPRFVSHKGLNKGEMKFLQEQYASHLIKGAIGMTVMTNALNYLITGTEIDRDEDGKFKGFKFNKGTAHWATENEEGHAFDLDTGMKDAKNRQIYVTPPIFRYIRDYFGWYGEPSRTFFNKAHPLPKATFEFLNNMSLWNKKQIVSYPELKDAPTLAKEWGMHFLYSVTPYGQFTGRPDELRGWTEKLVPWIGTWVRHGVGGGDWSMEINKQLREKGYTRDEIDKQIDLMAQGDPVGVIQFLMQSGRYKTMDGVYDRLRKYQNPLLWKYSLLSKDEKLEFIRKYSPSERDDFGKALRQGRPMVEIPTIKLKTQ